MITRQQIIDQLKTMDSLTRFQKDVEILKFLRDKKVDQDEIDKIVMDLVSYEQY